MLNFFYLFLKKYIPDRHFELLETDTDSIYFSISKENLDDCVSPHLKPNYFREKLKWLTSEVCPEHEEVLIQCKIENKEWDTRPCCSSFEAFDKRTLGKRRWNMKEKTKFDLLPSPIFPKEKRTNKYVKGCLLPRTLSPLINT